MEHGFVILGIVALLFISMYGYSYWSVAQEEANIDNSKQLELQKKKDELRLRNRLEHQAILEEKAKRNIERHEEIQHELKMLKEMRNKLKVS